MPLFVARFVMVQEDLWLAQTQPFDVVRRTERRYLESTLFAADDSEAAFSRATGMISGLSDSNCDGPGDRTSYSSLGLHELEEVLRDESTIDRAVREPYGIEIGIVRFDEGQPEVRPREELSVFTTRASDGSR